MTTVTLAGNSPSVGTGAWTIQSGTGGSFGNANSPTSTFSGTAGSTYVLRWTISNAPCTASFDEMTVTFNQNPTVTCPANFSVEDDDPAFALTGGSPTGGTYSGTGVSGGMFDPAVAGIGSHTINYMYTTAAGCSGSCTFTITVVDGCPGTGTVWFVNLAAASGGNGASWDCAFQKLQDAINAAGSGHEVWVKAGTYVPEKDPSGNASPADPRDKSFVLKSGVSVYGGFAGTETARSQRDWTANLTTLSGELGAAGNADNCYHVVISVSDASTTTLDGFTISGGNANGTGSISVEGQTVFRNYGGGMLNKASLPMVSHCIFSGNGAQYGGGAFNNNSTLTFSDCSFLNNTATSEAGMGNESSTSVTATNCVFMGNSATSGNGGGFYIGTSSISAVLTNCLFTGNSSSNAGGGIYSSGTPTVTLMNCTVSGNRSTSNGGGIAFLASNPTVTNCIVWNNRANNVTGSAISSIYTSSSTPVITYSLVQNQNPSGTGNLNGITYGSNTNYPNFVTQLDPATAPSAAGDFHITGCSPVVNMATTDGAPVVDLFGNARLGEAFDMGVHELQTAQTATVAMCKNVTVALDATGNVTLDAISLDNGSTGCAPLTFSASPNTFNCTDLGANTVTLAVTGANFYTDYCTSTITVIDNLPPNALCRDFVKNLDASGSVSILPAEVNNLSTDNCGTVNLVSVSPNSFTCSNIGQNTVTLLVNDGHGNQSQCNGIVTIADATNPTANCQNISVDLNASGTASITAAQVNNSSTDNCGIVSLSVSPSSFTCTNIGSQTVTLTVTDNSNLTSSCNATVTVSDATAPTASCQNITVNLGTNGTVGITSSQINNNSTDNCGIANLGVSPSSFNCSHIGSQMVTLTVTDNSNLTSTCTATVTVTDATNPTAVCQNITVNLDGSGNVSITGGQVDGGSMDNCGILSLSVSPNTFDINDLGTNNVTLTVTDNNNLTANCVAIVTVTNTNAPNAVCQPHTAVLGSNGSVTILPDDVDGGSTAVGGIASRSVLPNTLTCSNLGPAQVTLTVVGNNGQQASCIAAVTVQDNTDPAVICQNVSVNLNGNSAVITPSQVLNAALSTDNCGLVNAISVSPNSFNCSNLGPNSVTLTANDGHGNDATCTATVTVNDATVPTLVCQNVSVNLSVAGTANIVASQVYNASLSGDNCGTVNLVGVLPNSFTCSNLGANTVTLTGNDGHGNSSTCTAKVTVNDNLAPNALCRDIVVQLDASGNASITASQVNNGSSDNCAIGTLTVSPNTFTLTDLGINPVTLSVPDVNGNSNTCTAQVTVENNQLPNAVCQNISRSLDGGGQINLAATDVDGGSSALGGIASMSVSANLLDCSDLGSNTVTLTVIGNNGQEASCNATVTVSDNTAPALVCQNISVNLSGNSASITPSQVLNAALSGDNCGTVIAASVSPNSFTCSNLGANTVTLTANDGHGNSNTCAATVTVNDATAPMPVCQNITVNLDGNGNASITAVQVDGGSTDNCGIASLSASPNTFNVSNLGANNVTLTVTDNSSLTATCIAVVTVTNTNAPNAVCQPYMANFGSNGAVTITPANVDGGSSAVGGIASMSVLPNTLTCANIGTNSVTLTVVGNNGQQASCNATVTVSDNTAPTVVCQPVSVNLSGNSASITPSQVLNAALSGDNCGTVIAASVSPSSFTCSNLGANTVTLTVNDGNGNSNTCTATVTIGDNTAPNALCQNVSINLNNGMANVTPADIDNGSNDNCGTVNLVSVVPNSFTCINLGANSVTLTINDGHGNTNTCTATVTVNGSGMATWYDDDDNDGYGDPADSQQACTQPTGYVSNNLDCDDANAALNPATVWYKDADNDNYSDGTSLTQCTQPTNYQLAVNLTATSGDCNDGNAAIHPAAMEVCNSVDDNCDGQVDNGVLLTFYKDADGDGFGNPAVTVQACAPPATYVSNNTDCDDGDALEHPGQVWYRDADGDDYSDGTSQTACLRPANYFVPGELTATSGDCDDNNAAVNPAAMEVCNSVDDNCDGQVDNGVLLTFYKDADGDGFGNPSVTVQACAAPATYVSNNTDCDDGDALEHPGQVWYKDADGDDYSDGTSQTACLRPANYFVPGELTATSGDCDDNNAAVNPAAMEVCNSVDDNCDGQVDNGVLNTYYKDADGDGFGNPAVTVQACAPTATYVSNNTDCDDGDALEHPGQVWYKDADGDDYSDGTSQTACLRPANYFVPGELTATSGDCNDGNAAIHPGATETCNNLDDDCDNLIDTADPGYVDNTPPTAICKNITVQLDVNGAVTITGAQVNNGSFDACGLAGFNVSPSSFDCEHLGDQTVVLTVTDVSGLQSTCTATVTIADDQHPCCAAPAAVCQNIFVQLDANGSALIMPNDVDGGSTAECGVQSISLNQNSFGCNDLGNNPVTLTITDINGDGDQCTANVNVQDATSPTAICKATTIFLGASGQATLTPAMVNNGSSDNCSLNLSLSQTSFDCGDVGPNIITLYVFDPSENNSSCTATVNVVDNLPPTALCKNTSVSLNNSGMGSITAAQINNGSADNCDIFGFSVSPSSFTCNDVGSKTVTLTVTDVNSNTSNCTAIVSISDNLSPAVFCKNISIQLGAGGTFTVSPNDVYLSGTDNCGMVNLVSVFPNYYDCGNIGPNTATLQVNDGHGNTASCQSTVTIGEFITITDIQTTPEDCGMANGTISITATALGGQLAYSIDGGANWQLMPNFDNLATGSYAIVVKAFGTAGCTVQGGNITVGQTGNPTLWWKDWDGDGYTDGISQSNCIQPAGYVANALPGDCNDLDPEQHPGQIWYRDWDGDEYGNGVSTTSCLRPFGYYLADELINISGDCNDNLAACYPGAPETCNGLDDDCDGLVDEGLGDLVFNGNVVFSNQAQVNAWSQCYTVINGNLTIQNAGIDSLASLRNLRKVTGNVLIKLTSLDSLSWLMKLDTVGASLTIQNNSQLETLHGLDSLKRVGSTLSHHHNLECAECCAIYDLLNTPGGIGGAASIFLNETGCNSIGQVNTECSAGGGNLVAPTGCTDCPAVPQSSAMQESQGFSIFPNPATEVAQVLLQRTFSSGRIRLFDPSGRLIFQDELETGAAEYRLKIHKLTAGIYFVQVLIDGQSFGKKLSVE